MSKIIVISAYPKGKDSLGEALLEKAKGSNEVEVLNLFDYSLPYYKGENELLGEAKKVFEKLEENNNWLFLFPVWWSNMPAILKNFFDWGIRYGLIYDGKSVPSAALEGKCKKAAIFSTSGDVYDEYKEQVTGLLKDEILQYWGVEVIGTLFIEDTYNFSNAKFNESQAKLTELINTF